MIPIATGQSTALNARRWGLVVLMACGLTMATSGPLPIAHWSFDEVSEAGVCEDESGNGHHAQLFRATLVQGLAGRAVRLDGKAGGQILTRLTAGAFGGDFTVSLWMKPEGKPREAGIFSALGQRSPGFCMQMNQGQLGVYSAKYSARSLLTADTWHHVAMTYSKATGRVRIYIDSKQVVEEAMSVAVDETVLVTLGRFYADYDGYYYRGLLDEVSVYSQVVTPDHDPNSVITTPATMAALPELPIAIDEDGWYARQIAALPCYWEQVTRQAGWRSRDSSGEVVFDNQLWLFGGWYDSSTPGLRDVWKSTDGATWSEVTAKAPWMHGDLPMSLTFKGKMWFMGGWHGGRLPDASASDQVWSSSDGAEWTLEAEHAAWSPRLAAATVVFKDHIYLLGGLERYLDGNIGHQKNDVWRSADGKTWELVTAEAEWAPRAFHQAVVFGDRIYLFGGGNYLPVYQARNDVWSSTDGKTWELLTDQAGWSPRIWFSAVVHKERMWVLGGWSNNPSTNWNDVWHSTDGKTWKRLVPAWPSTVWSPRHEQSAYVFGNSIWIVGGNAYPLVNDVWRLRISEDWDGD